MRAALLMMTCAICLAACASPGPQSLVVNQPDDCERVLQSVNGAALRKDADFRVLYFRQTVALRIANKTINSGRECIAAQRQHYAKGH
jgi:hypothetical protein